MSQDGHDLRLSSFLKRFECNSIFLLGNGYISIGIEQASLVPANHQQIVVRPSNSFKTSIEGSCSGVMIEVRMFAHLDLESQLLKPKLESVTQVREVSDG